MSRISLLRHGATIGGARYNGSTDVALSETGLQQVVNAAWGRHWDLIITSPLQRCAGFARDLARQREIPLDTDARLQEMHFGDWEGRSAKALMQDDAGALRRFWQDPLKYPPPNAEPLPDLRQRVLSVLRELQAENTADHVLLVTHGGPIRVILAERAGIPLQELLSLEVPYAGLFDLD